MSSWYKRLRNVAGMALILGVAIGIWLADWFQGLGTGKSGPSSLQVSLGTDGASELPAREEIGPPTRVVSESTTKDEPSTGAIELTAIIDGHEIFLKNSLEESPISAPQLASLVREADGNEDGIRLRILRRRSSRVSTETALQDALREANVPDAAVFWVPTPMD